MGVHYKLHYFDLRGLGEPIRLLFHYVGEPFEDVRYSRESWPDNKSKFLFGKMPVLEVDGKPLSQSAAIARFIAEKNGLAGKDDWERAQVNAVLDFHKDVTAEMRPWFAVKLGFQPGDITELTKTVFQPAVKTNFPIYEKLLKESKSGFFAPSGVTFVDFFVADAMSTIKKMEPSVLADYPTLANYVERVLALPQLKKYMSTRKE